MRILVAGGCGFIGPAAVMLLANADHQVLNIDKLTHAGDLRTVAALEKAPNYRFEKLDISDRPNIETNLHGTFVMQQTALDYWHGLGAEERARFRFIQVSTDEVYGSLGNDGLFTENTAYQSNSPYSASKAGADHLARAWYETFGLPTIVSNCSNNYRPFQNREKLIPTIIRKALTGQPIPIYGDGNYFRDWLYVDDHINALLAVCAHGNVGSRYNVGGHSEISNLNLAHAICALLDQRRPGADGRSHADQIQFVADRRGHDYRYAIDTGRPASTRRKARP